MVSRYAIHDGTGWTPRLVPRRAAEAAEPEQAECAAKRPENAWLPAILKALDVFPEAQALVRRTILRLYGYAADEDSS
jgi:hypothetical protein